MILQTFEIITKVNKIVTDGGSNFVCAFRDRPRNLDLISEQNSETSDEIAPVSVANILSQYDDEAYALRAHQRCASHNCNLIMNDDIESSRKAMHKLYEQGTRSRDVLLAREFFETFDAVVKECQKLWFRQQRSSVSLPK